MIVDVQLGIEVFEKVIFMFDIVLIKDNIQEFVM